MLSHPLKGAASCLTGLTHLELLSSTMSAQQPEIKDRVSITMQPGTACIPPLKSPCGDRYELRRLRAQVDAAGFEAEMASQKSRSREAVRAVDLTAGGNALGDLAGQLASSAFIGAPAVLCHMQPAQGSLHVVLWGCAARPVAIIQ